MKKIKLTILPGDGIGQDVMAATLPIFDVLKLPFELVFGEIGWECWKREGDPIPKRTWDFIKTSDATLLGAITSKPEREALLELSPKLKQSPKTYVSPVIQLRQQLDLFVNIRPCINVTGSKEDFNFCVIRENTEGLYSGFDYYPIPDSLKTVIDSNPKWSNKTNSEISCALRLQSRSGLQRLFEYAFAYAEKNKFKRVTLADKPNVLRKSGALAREIFEIVAKDYPHLNADILNVDAVSLWLVRRPEEFGVIVAENMFGDILSDVGAGITGGLGFAPSANIGAYGCYFEPVHGSAPNIKPNCANPSAMFLTIGLLLEHFGYHCEANRIKQAVKEVINEDLVLTYDLKGKATTKEMANAIIEKFCSPLKYKYISFLTTGNEIINGDITDANMNFFTKKIYECEGIIYQQVYSSDKKSDIERALEYLLPRSDAVIVTGGLGPTSDDCTRFAIRDIVKQELIFNELAWNHIVERLQRFDIEINLSNKQQALFPSGSTLIPNENGTAFGCHIATGKKNIFMLPGPPKESRPMFNNFVIPKLTSLGFFNNKSKIYKWFTMGLIESNIAPEIDQIAFDCSLKTSYRWIYPYLEIKVIAPEGKEVQACINKIEKILHSFTISNDSQTGFELLSDALKNLNFKIEVHDNLTLGSFEEIIHCDSLIYSTNDDVHSNNKIIFLANASPTMQNQNKFTGSITFECKGFLFEKCMLKHQIRVPNRGPEILEYAKAYLAWQLYRFIVMCREKNEFNSTTVKL